MRVFVAITLLLNLIQTTFLLALVVVILGLSCLQGNGTVRLSIAATILHLLIVVNTRLCLLLFLLGTWLFVSWHQIELVYVLIMRVSAFRLQDRIYNIVQIFIISLCWMHLLDLRHRRQFGLKFLVCAAFALRLILARFFLVIHFCLLFVILHFGCSFKLLGCLFSLLNCLLIGACGRWSIIQLNKRIEMWIDFTARVIKYPFNLWYNFLLARFRIYSHFLFLVQHLLILMSIDRIWQLIEWALLLR